MLASLQLFDGTVNSPGLNFGTETGSGLYRIGAFDLGFSVNQVKRLEFTVNGLRVTDGAVATPSLSFFNDTGSGLYRIGLNDIGFAVNGVKNTEWTATSFGIGGTPDSTTQAEILAAGSSWSGNNYGQNLIIKGARNNSIGIFDGAGANPWAITNNGAAGLKFSTMPALTDSVTGPTLYMTVSTSGVTIGASGTAISASYAATLTASLGAVGANTCVQYAGNQITVTGAVSGDVCTVGIDKLSAWPGGLGLPACATIGANTVELVVCNPTAGILTPPVTTAYRVRVFDP
jgi:hypothetical protein